MGNIEDRPRIPLEEERVELTDAGRDCLRARPLLIEAARMLRRPERVSEAERAALVRQIEACLDGDGEPPFEEDAGYEPGCAEEWP
jgi:hypothetical protein